MIFPFYNNDKKAYTIDDANIGCNRVIVSDCDNGHHYASLCELIADCPSVKQLTRDCVVDALNNLNNITGTNSLDPSKWFLRVTSDGCLEVADPRQNGDQDKYVVVSEEDNLPGPLDQKVKGSCSYDGLYCIDIEEAGPQLLVWRPSGPKGPFLTAALPYDTCDAEDGKGYIVRMQKSGDEWEVGYSCPEIKEDAHYCKCIYTGGMSATPCCSLWYSDPNKRYGRTVRYFLPHKMCPQNIKPADDYQKEGSDSFINGDWNIKGTKAFAAPTSYGVVKIVKSGVYAISYSTYIKFNQTLKSIRCGLYVPNEEGVLTELNDIKYQCGEYPGQKGLPGGNVTVNFPALNRMFPNEYNATTWAHYDDTGWTLDNTGLPFTRTYLLDVTKPTEIYMAVKPDMRPTDPRLIQENDSESRYNIRVSGTSDEDEYGASTTIELYRLGDAVLPSMMDDIIFVRE